MTDKSQGLFDTYAAGDRIPKHVLLETFSKAGILRSDPRLSRMFKSIDGLPEQIDAQQFRLLHDCSPALFEKVLSGQMTLPQFDSFCLELDRMFSETAEITDGKLADYIPQLARVNQEKFAM